MSPPDTNIEKQKRRHRPALVGIGSVAIFAAIVFILNVYTATDEDAGFVENGPQAPLGESSGN